MPNTLLDIEDPNGNNAPDLKESLDKLRDRQASQGYHLPGQGCEIGVGR